MKKIIQKISKKYHFAVLLVMMLLITSSVINNPVTKAAAVSVCGNSIIESGEQCDDGNLIDGDGCSSACTLDNPVFYVDYSLGTPNLECSVIAPCNTVERVFNSIPFSIAATDATPKDIAIKVQGTLQGANEHIRFESTPAGLTALSYSIEPWNSNPIINNGYLRIYIENIIIDGFEITNSDNGTGAIWVDNSNITVQNSYLYNNNSQAIAVLGNYDNTKIYNNVLIDNDQGFTSCGLYVFGGMTNTKIINNTLYNNCGGVRSSSLGDIYVMAGKGGPTTGTIIKQNIVYNDLAVPAGIYYESGVEVNGSTTTGVLTDQVAADFGNGNNFHEKLTIPFFYDYSYNANLKMECPIVAFNSKSFIFARLFIPNAYAAAVAPCMEVGTAFSLSDTEYTNYQISSADSLTPATDFLGNARPSGELEAGAIETLDAAIAGGGSGDKTPNITSEGTVIECTPLPTQLDIKDAIVTQLDGNPAVTLKWGQSGLMDINPNQKIEIFFDYLALYPPAIIGSNNVRLQNVFANHIYSEASSPLKELIDNKLETINTDVCDNEMSERILKVVKEMNADPEINSMIINFIDDLLSLENTLIESSGYENSYFSNYYYNLFKNNGNSSGSIKVIRKVNKSGIYLDDQSFEINSEATSWTDTKIPLSDNAKNYKYQIVTENCGQVKKGTEAEVIIDPIIPAGTNVDVTLNLKIKIKEAYNNLMMDRFRKLFIENEQTAYDNIRSCEEVREEFFQVIDADHALECLIACYGENDLRLINEITLRQKLIVPPLVKMINLELSEDYIKAKTSEMINDIKYDIQFSKSIQTYAKNEQLMVGNFVNKLNINELDTSDMEIMKMIGADYFEGVSHSSNITIEKYDADDNLLETYNANTDIFGNVTVGIGEFISGDDYTLKIKLADERFVLPKIATLQINNAIKELKPFDTIYTSEVGLEFDRSFRYGDFNEDGKINLGDIGEWGNLLSGNISINGYELWEIWEFANLDGLEGINLLDIVILQENWGGLKESRIEDTEIKLRALLEPFGITLTTDTKLDTMVKAVSWLDLIGAECK